jgi:hypothetical protein
MVWTETDARGLVTEDGWPALRLRIAFSLILFCFFELFIGKRLPEVTPYVSFGLGVFMLGWAMNAIQEWKLKAQIALIKDAIDRRP